MADRLVKHLSHVGDFLLSQRAVVDDSTYKNMVEVHFESCKKALLDAGGLGPQEASEVSQSFTKGPWPETYKAEFAIKLSEVVAGTASGNSPKAKRPSQECPHFRCFLSSADRAILQDASRSESEKLDQIACRCLKIGLFLPTETTSGAIIIAAIASGLESTSPQQFYATLSSFKRRLKTKREKLSKNMPVQLTDYPQTVDLLPDNLKQSYKDDPADPVPMDLCMQVHSQETLRKSSSKLAGNKSALVPSGAASSSSADFGNMNPMVMMGTLMQQCMQMMQSTMPTGSNSQASSVPGLHIFTPNQGKQAKQQLQLPGPPTDPTPSASQLALPPTQATETPAVPPVGSPDPNQSPAGTEKPAAQAQEKSADEDYEMAEQLGWMQGIGKGKNSKKKPSGKQQAMMKKPVAAPSTVSAKAKAIAKGKAHTKSKCSPPVKTIKKKSGWMIQYRRRASDQTLYGKWISPSGESFKSSNLAAAAGFDPDAP